MAPTAGEQHAAAAAATAAAAAAAAGSCSSEADCATPSSAATAAASLLAALGELADIQQPSLQEGDSDYELDEYEQLDLGDLFVNTDLREEVQDALARFLRPERVLLRDKLTFVLGIMHMVLSAYWLGCSPQTFYRLYTTEACVLITLRLAHYRWHRQHYYLLDWCYLANALVILSILKPTNILLAKVTFAHAMGPLLWSILAFRNSIVPHSLGKMTSHFMHWFPACVCWATRWKTSGALKAHLESFPAAQAQWESASLRDLVWLPLVPYLGWATLYYIKVFVISSKKIQERGYETLFQYSTKSRKSLFGAVVLRAPPRLQPVAYMGLHLLLTLTACLLNTLWWRSYIANTLFMVGVLTASAWSGATFYFDVFLFKYGLSNESRGANPSTEPVPLGFFFEFHHHPPPKCVPLEFRRTGMRHWLACAAFALAALPLATLLRAYWLPRSCDTTYLWEGYEQVPLTQIHSRYRLIRFKDADPERREVYKKLQRLHVVPVLFVHGHLGTHQQMRSAASETGRELARRLTANASWPLWLQWYSTDFNAEASALDAALLDKQAEFVVRCIQHLLRIHSSSNRHKPFRLVLVGYSMGGMVARDVVRRLSAYAAEGFDPSYLVALVCLGSPHHFPAFVPRVLLSTVLKPAKAKEQAAASVIAAAAPRVNIMAGAGDFSLPLTHPSAATPLAPESGPQLSTLMRDMPGVWSTGSHKGIVSCNQLVRQVVPLLIDAVMVSLDGEQQHHQGVVQWQAAVQQLLHQRLTTNTAKAMHWPALALGAEFTAEHPAPCCVVASAGAAAELPEQVEATLLHRSVPPGHSLQLTWRSAQLRASGRHGLLLLVTAAPPCSHWAVQATLADGRTRQLAAVAAPLPPLLQALQLRWVPRHWGDVMQGVDWQHNATRLLYVPFAGMPAVAGGQPQPVSQVSLAIRGSGSGGTGIMAQVLDAHPLNPELQPGSQQHLPLPPPGRSTQLQAGHAAAVAVSLPRHVWPLSSGACSSGKGVDFSCLAVLLLGTTPPWTLHIQPQQCGSKVDSQDQENILPAIVGVQAGAGAADSVRVAWSGTGSASSGAVQLWDGVAPLGQLLLVSDPRCAYALRLRWDLGGWLGLSLRHLLFVLPILCMALSQARLSPMAGSTARVAVVSAVVAAWGSLHPDMLASVGGGMRPWVQLSVVEALSALLLAGGGVALVDGLLSISLRLLQWALPLKQPKQARLSSLACLAVVVASSLLHPAAPAYLGCCCLAVQLAARQQASASLAARGGAEDGAAVAADGARGPSIPLAWLMFYTQLALLPTVGLVGWLVSGMQHAAEWTDGRVLVAALALHACLVGCARARPTGGAVQERPPQPPKHIELASLAAAAAHEAAACLTAAASLWGHPYFALYAASGSAALDALALALAAAGKLS